VGHYLLPLAGGENKHVKLNVSMGIDHELAQRQHQHRPKTTLEE
jgi:hypothetical protein